MSHLSIYLSLSYNFVFQWAYALSIVLPAISIGTSQAFSVTGYDFYTRDRHPNGTYCDDGSSPHDGFTQDQASWFGMSANDHSILFCRVEMIHVNDDISLNCKIIQMLNTSNATCSSEPLQPNHLPYPLYPEIPIIFPC